MSWWRKQGQKQFSAVTDTASQRVRVSVPELLALRSAARALPLEPGAVRGALSGGYLSPFKGRGMEFDEVRPYQPGDDVRSLDWRVTARTGKPHTKLFRDERERAVLLWADFRAPMFFASRGVFKSVLVARAAALLAWSATQQGDRIGGLLFNDYQHRELRPQRGSQAALRMIEQLTRFAEPGSDQQESTADANRGSQSLAQLRRVVHPGSLVVLMSDFRRLDEQAEACVMQLSRHNDVLLFFVHDPLEAELPPPGQYQLGDGQRQWLIDSGNHRARKVFVEQFQQRRAMLQRWCQCYRLRFAECHTEQAPLSALQQGLVLRPGDKSGCS